MSIQPGAAEAFGALLQFDRAGVARGEWWRLVTGFLAHWSLAHAMANALGLAIFSWLIATSESSKALLAVVAAALVFQVFALLLIALDSEYRGASGFLYALATFALLGAARKPGHRMVPAVIATAAIARFAWDAASGSPSPLLPQGVATAWPMHVAGVAAGAAVFLQLRTMPPPWVRQGTDDAIRSRAG